jgi:hypothetical protein
VGLRPSTTRHWVDRFVPAAKQQVEVTGEDGELKAGGRRRHSRRVAESVGTKRIN